MATTKTRKRTTTGTRLPRTATYLAKESQSAHDLVLIKNTLQRGLLDLRDCDLVASEEKGLLNGMFDSIENIVMGCLKQMN